MQHKQQVVRAVAVMGLAASGAAFAQDSYLLQRLSILPEYSATRSSGVSVYGTVDESINAIKAGSAASKVQMQSGGEYTSKFGIYGSEDLGGGLKVEFNLEAGLQADTGAQQDTTSLFNRASWVGLKSREWGTVRMGNQLAATLPLFVDVYGVVTTNSAYTWVGASVVQSSKGVGYNSDLGAGATTLPTRVPKSVMYQSPRVSGFGTQLMYATNSTGATYPTASNKGAVLSYERAPFYLGVSYNQIFSTPVVITTGTPAVSVRNDMYGFGGVYDTGKIVLSTSFMQLAPKLAQDGIARVTTLGAILPDGRNAYRASLVYRDTSGVRNSAGAVVASSALGLVLGYDYELSRRTGLYSRLAKVRNFGASTVIYNSASLPLQTGSANPQTGVSTSSLSLGMYHHF